MAGIAEELKFVAVKAVAAVGGDVEQRDGSGDGEQDRQVGAGREHGMPELVICLDD